MTRTVAILDAHLRRRIESRLPDWLDPHFVSSRDQLLELAPLAELGWIDSADALLPQIVTRGEKLRWLHTIAAGVDFIPIPLLRERGVTLTNCAGMNAAAMAEYVVMGMLVTAKRYHEVVRGQERRHWLADAPGKGELAGSRALIIGAGGIGGRVATLLEAFGVEVVGVRRHPAAGALGPDDWRSRLGEFDWVIVIAPSTPDTAHMIGAAELSAMKPSATLVNFARGALVDTAALVEALAGKRIGGAFLDVTDPEPLPPDHPLWGFGNVHISMHLSGRSQTSLLSRAIDRFLENLDRWHRGEPLLGQVDLTLGY